MSIRALTPADAPAYAAFRRELWPSHPAGGHWEVLEIKYFTHPHRDLCPGSDLYGYFQRDRLLGIMGAYPMPVTLEGAVYPGHMLVDWAVLPKFQFGPIAGHLWNALVRLPGRKFASHGSRFSQGPLEKRGAKIHVIEATGVVSMISGVAARLLNLSSYTYPSPFYLDRLETVPGISLIDARDLRAAAPGAPGKIARIHRGSDFWLPYCDARMYNGAIPLRVAFGQGEADLVLKIMEAGPCRFCTLLSARLEPYNVACALAVGRILGAFLRRNGASTLSATEADAELRALIKAASIHVRRSASYWWSIPQPADTFRHDEVSWWLTAADRDSHFGGLQPCRER